jgi:hypothetical protein
MAQNRGTDANTAGQQAQIVLTLLRTLLGDGQGSSQIHPPSERRAISPATQERDRQRAARLLESIDSRRAAKAKGRR